MNDSSPTAMSKSITPPLIFDATYPEATVISHDEEPAPITAEALADLEVPEDVRISPSGKQVVYCLRLASRRGANEVTSLWLADVGKEHSARQITSGRFHDEMPQWSPDGTTLAFISDRAIQGHSSAVYLLPLSDSDPFAITDPKNQKKISFFRWSPNGQYIAFLSPDEDTTDEGSKESQKDDPIVYGAHWDFNRLRRTHLQTKTTLTLINEPFHVLEFAWSAKSNQIIFASQRTPEWKESALRDGVNFGLLSVKFESKMYLCTFRGPIKYLSWLGDYFYFLGGVAPNKNNTASMIYRVSKNGLGLAPFAYGANNCATKLRWAASSLAVQVEEGPKDQIALIADSSQSIIYNDTYAITTWDILDAGDNHRVLVIGRGSPNKPTDLYSVEGQELRQLSQHSEAIATLDVAESEICYFTASDNTELDAVLLTPKSAGEKPWPTIVLPHGGPLERVTLSFDVPIFHWGPWLAAAGYAVLCPNYRGSSSRGEDFARYGRGRVGTKDYSDIIDTIKSGIERGLFDPERIAIGGWSQGGFLTYLAVTRQDFPFKAAVCGGGVTDWDMLVMTSDVPTIEAEMAGGAPWEMKASEVRTRDASAVWHMIESSNSKTSILILHSECDERVPVSQATAFHRGCLFHELPCELVVYPRERHIVAERLHRIDMLERTKRFYDLHLR